MDHMVRSLPAILHPIGHWLLDEYVLQMRHDLCSVLGPFYIGGVIRVSRSSGISIPSQNRSQMRSEPPAKFRYLLSWHMNA
ncbi:MAG: hypothetical protein CM1200mP22_16360 [Dehalococcoidia bacterium]|nr:MAG: hypothetical protein CM1200mP22_16360 [Dehalococcoidia bacterium]